MKLEPRDSASVFWVGHSLIEGQAETKNGSIDLMQLVGTFARERGLAYSSCNHTLWGASLSALWQGRPHNYDRDAKCMIARRQAFEADPTMYDTLVMTEIVPLQINIKKEFSALYMRRFYCALKKRVPHARVFLYQTWANFQASHSLADYPPAPFYDWLATMHQQSAAWRNLAKAACLAHVPAPTLLSRIGLHAKTDGGCVCHEPIGIIPVGEAMINLAKRLAHPLETDDFLQENDQPLRLHDLVANPFIDWPEHWPLAIDDGSADEALTRAEKLTLRNTAEPHDDIHLSAIGIYFAALVHFAVIYQQTPLGLPGLAGLRDTFTRTLQSIVWQTVEPELLAPPGPTTT